MNSRVNLSQIANLDAASSIAAANRHLPPALSLLLVLLVGWQLARIVWLLVPGPAAGAAVVSPSSLSSSSLQSKASAYVTEIAATHIFGIADAESDTLAIAPTDEPRDDTNLVLTLKGTVASTRRDFSVALISDGSKEQKVYVIGDSINSRASLHAIYADRVVLNENGVLTNLKLPREYANVAVASARRSNRTIRQSPTKSIQNVVSQNLTRLTDVIRPTPYIKNGQPAGYRVYPGRDRRQFAALGLRPGDIIKDIDGQSLTDPTQAMKIFQSLGTSDQVTVTVERNGQAQTIILKTNQLDLGGEQTK
jgi:general secretion pathway protein C